jgi:hypothetical protein
MIQEIDHVHPKFKFLGFRNSNAFDEIGIESEHRRPLDPLQTKSADLSGSGIHKNNIALSIRNRLVAEYAIESIRGTVNLFSLGT